MRLKINKRIVLALVAALLSMTAVQAQTAPTGNKQERNHVRAGNSLYKNKRYAEAEVEYRKALQANPNSEAAQFNLATALMRQGNAQAKSDDKNNPMSQAQSLLTNLAKNASSKRIRGKASYDLGNIAYQQQQYAQAIEYYKNALRCDPDDDQARDNLRLAQLKKQEQDQNKDKNQDQNKDQNQDQDKDQNKDQNQDQNKDQNQDQNKDQDQDKQDQQNQNQQDQNQQQSQPQDQREQQGGMSQQNAEQVLKAMQDQERATQQRINQQKAQQQRHERQRTNRKW